MTIRFCVSMAIIIAFSTLGAPNASAAQEFPVAPPGPFLASFALSVNRATPEVARLNRVEVSAQHGLFGGGFPTEPEMSLLIACDERTPCARGIGRIYAGLGPQLERRATFTEPERTRITKKTVLWLQLRRFAYVLRPMSDQTGLRLVSVESLRNKFYRLRRRGRRLKIAQVHEECFVSRAPALVPPGEQVAAGFSPSRIYREPYSATACPSGWPALSAEVLVCEHEGTGRCVEEATTRGVRP